MRPRGAIQAIQLRIRSDFRRIIRAGRRRLNARRGENIRDDDISRERRGGTARTTDNEGACVYGAFAKVRWTIRIRNGEHGFRVP